LYFMMSGALSELRIICAFCWICSKDFSSNFTVTPGWEVLEFVDRLVPGDAHRAGSDLVVPEREGLRVAALSPEPDPPHAVRPSEVASNNAPAATPARDLNMPSSGRDPSKRFDKPPLASSKRFDAGLSGDARERPPQISTV